VYSAARKSVYYTSPSTQQGPFALENPLVINYLLFNVVQFAQNAVKLETLFLAEHTRPSLFTCQYCNFVPLLARNLKNWFWSRSDWGIFCSVTRLRKGFFSDRVLGSIQLAVAVMLASLVTIIPALRELFDFSYWSAVTVTLVMERSSLATTFNNLILRMLGTVTGAMWGYLALLVTDGELWASLALLFVWVWIAGYVRSSPTFSYAGTVSAFTCAIVMYTADGVENARDVALSRIEQTYLGLFIVIVVSLVRPVSARLVLRKQVRATLQQLAGHIVNSIECFVEDHSIITADSAIFASLAKLRSAVSGHDQLYLQALTEPRLWRQPFHKDYVSQILASEKALLIRTIALARTAASASEAVAHDLDFLLSVVILEMKNIEVEMCRSVTELADSFRFQKPKKLHEAASDHSFSVSYRRLTVTCTFDTLSNNVGNLLQSLVRNHRDGPLVATEAMIVFHAFLFSLRRLIDEMNSLWQAGNELVALTTLYSKGVLKM